RGQVMETGGVDEVTQHPRHPYSIALTAAAPVPQPAEQARRRAAREALGVGTAGGRPRPRRRAARSLPAARSPPTSAARSVPRWYPESPATTPTTRRDFGCLP